MTESFLLGNQYTCVLYRGENVVFKSKESGVAPLVKLIDEGVDANGCLIEDKIVGKAAAFLYAYLGISYVRAAVVSKAGLSVLQQYKVGVEYGVLAENIVNRRGDGICPMEEAVQTSKTPCEALSAVKAKLSTLRGA